nr:winged helix-turn-helix transcriptional regulator [Actinoplanes sp. TFC3]
MNRVILYALHDQPLQYSKLHHAVSQASPDVVHARTLTRTLRHLEDEGLVEHRQDADTADYRLMTAGIELVELLTEIERWTREHRTNEGDGDGR